jgi:hypothetical protein
MMEKMRVF